MDITPEIRAKAIAKYPLVSEDSAIEAYLADLAGKSGSKHKTAYQMADRSQAEVIRELRYQLQISQQKADRYYALWLEEKELRERAEQYINGLEDTGQMEAK
jgi:hypothetical protein